MRAFRNFSIQRKLTWLMMVIGCATLSLAVVSFSVYEVLMFQRAQVRALSTQAQIIAANSTAALVFGDTGSAAETLSALAAEPSIVSAAIYSTDGKLFASYRRKDAGASAGSVTLSYPVMFAGKRIATISLQASRAALAVRLVSYTAILAVIAAASILIALALSSALQKLISAPILRLAHVMSEVSAEHNYSIPAIAHGEDEIGLLIGHFHKLLAQIRERDEALRQAHDELEQRVLDRTSELQLEIAQHEQTQAHLLFAKKEADEANRAKSEFLANMSHELRTPLNAIIGYSEMLHEVATDRHDIEYIPDLERICMAGRHQLTLINDVLDLAKIEAGRMRVSLENFAVEPVVQEVASSVQSLALKNHNLLNMKIDGPLGNVHLDATKVKQCLWNLLGNACKFTENGVVTLAVARRKEQSREWIVFEVVDTGIGMSAGQMQKLFRAFSQVDSSSTRKHGGSGLGLMISRRFSRMMGGDIQVYSEPGKGSSFTLTLPVNAGAEESAQGFENNQPVFQESMAALSDHVSKSPLPQAI
ncbi:MAG TPA: ATP-binding protein [Bryobacteraceae bacterium]|nr:ATP-binding protein [Bryobacteraceae bacterium]